MEPKATNQLNVIGLYYAMSPLMHVINTYIKERSKVHDVKTIMRCFQVVENKRKLQKLITQCQYAAKEQYYGMEGNTVRALFYVWGVNLGDPPPLPPPISSPPKVTLTPLIGAQDSF